MSNELTDVRCHCGAEFPADSYDAGFIAGSGMCQNCDAAMPPKDIPALAEQAGGDERAAFEAAFAAMGRPVCRADYDQDAYGTPFDDGGWTGWQARAALAQPSPAPELSGTGTTYESLYRIASDQLSKANDRYGDLYARYQKQVAERDAALARVAELERQEPVALANRGLHAFWVKWTEAAAGLYGPGIKLYAAPVAKAQHSVQEGYALVPVRETDAMHDAVMALLYKGVARTDTQKLLDAYIAAAPAQAQHSLPVAREQLERLVRILDAHNYAKDAEALMALLAAAHGKEGV
ncbi:hypothetical protein JEY29_18675 [Pseudomonas aeruginosa]|nr:hypothetical protein [Pseudomonas aeruginosa]